MTVRQVKHTGLEQLVAGVDEAGRGPLAGPVVAAAVILDPDRPIAGLGDSKTIPEARRISLAAEIRDKSIAWAIARIDNEQIDNMNILNATMLAMEKSVAALAIAPRHVQVDGNRCPRLDCSVESIIRGDALVAAIGAASILAKVDRDSVMLEMERHYPGYGFARHKGYPTRQHREALALLGVCAIHRRSFAPVRLHLSQR